jgi:hypothetical protein
MSHITGVVLALNPPITIGPSSGVPPDAPDTWSHQFSHPPAPDGTKLLILHFHNIDLPPGNRLEVDLGYGTDVFTDADGPEFWTRPVNVYRVPGGLVPVRYVAAGSDSGGVELDRYGRGQRHAGDADPTAYSNCDPFLGTAQYVEPDYDPFWYCTEPPTWENAACAPNDVRRRARVHCTHGEVIAERADRDRAALGRLPAQPYVVRPPPALGGQGLPHQLRGQRVLGAVAGGAAAHAGRVPGDP